MVYRRSHRDLHRRVHGGPPGEGDRPELAAEVERMCGLFHRLGYRNVDDFGVNLPKDTFLGRLRNFLIHPDRTRTTPWSSTTPATAYWTAASCCCRCATRPPTMRSPACRRAT